MDQKIAFSRTSGPCQSHSIHHRPTTSGDPPSEPPKTQNSKIPERHDILKRPSQNSVPNHPHRQRVIPRLCEESGQTPRQSRRDIERLPLLRAVSLVFTHPSTYHRKVYGRSRPRTSPRRMCLSETRHSALPFHTRIEVIPWRLSP